MCAHLLDKNSKQTFLLDDKYLQKFFTNKFPDYEELRQQNTSTSKYLSSFQIDTLYNTFTS